MNAGNTLFAQLMKVLPWQTYALLFDEHGRDRYTCSLACAELFRVMAYVQLTYRGIPRDIEICPSAHATKLYHMGFRREIKGT